MKRRRRTKKASIWPKDAEVIAAAINSGFARVEAALAYRSQRAAAEKVAFDLDLAKRLAAHLVALHGNGGTGSGDSYRYQSSSNLVNEARAAGWV